MLTMDFKEEVIKASPIVATGIADGAARLFCGLSINEWFYVAAIAYTLVQIAAKIVDIVIRWKKQIVIQSNNKQKEIDNNEEED